MNIERFKSKYPDVVQDGLISLILVSTKIQELPYLIRDGFYDQSYLDEFKHDFNMLDVQRRRDEALEKILG